MPRCEFPKNEVAEQFTLRKGQGMENMISTPIFTLDRPGSSKKVRFEENIVVKFLLKLVKCGLREEGVEVVMVQGGRLGAILPIPWDRSQWAIYLRSSRLIRSLALWKFLVE